MSAPVTTPPAPITGMSTASTISGSRSRMRRSVPRCPPASKPSTATAEAPNFCASFATRALPTIGTIGTPASLHHVNTSREKPAPAITRSIPSSSAAWTSSLNLRTATMMLTPMTPPSAMARAVRISSRNSSTVRPLPAMMPIPPAAATAPARGASEIRTAMPPWMMGRRAVRLPMVSEGMSTVVCDLSRGEWWVALSHQHTRRRK